MMPQYPLLTTPQPLSVPTVFESQQSLQRIRLLLRETQLLISIDWQV